MLLNSVQGTDIGVDDNSLEHHDYMKDKVPTSCTKLADQ